MKCEYCQDQAAQPCQQEATHSLTVTVKTGYDGSGDGGDYCETHARGLAAILRDGNVGQRPDYWRDWERCWQWVTGPRRCHFL